MHAAMFDQLLARVDAALDDGDPDDDGGLTAATVYACDMARRGMLDELARRGGFIPPVSRRDEATFLQRLAAAPQCPAVVLARIATMAVAALEVGVLETGNGFYHHVFEQVGEPAGSIAHPFLLSLTDPGEGDEHRVLCAEVAVGYVLKADFVEGAWRETAMWLLRQGGQPAGVVALQAFTAAETADVHPGGAQILAGLAGDWSGTLDELVETATTLAGRQATTAQVS